jgi:hypothetical protein
MSFGFVSDFGLVSKLEGAALPLLPRCFSLIIETTQDCIARGLGVKWPT